MTTFPYISETIASSLEQDEDSDLDESVASLFNTGADILHSLTGMFVYIIARYEAMADPLP